jgi:hypothetical protein
MDQFRGNDPDYEQESKAERGVLEIISCYQELLRERKVKKRYSTLDAHIIKKKTYAEDPQPSPSSGA